ncbi:MULTISPECIES: TonB-dependent receptor [Asticcacaulis]|uniref:TonB-dependent receptor n=1 Tax=Asticcacaulis TaxID=76890 RepID=UPI001AE20155|nr:MULTISPECIES: TonB-dependent receptor [Asticcacaulis]MBP2160854.1 iron complex outermembrane receptor protein [Asticcacaulis solisilvae]MDR6801942.1 iron complex outermembrane receptor protein [Asticcacaulis sp. BE141]
MKFKRHILMTSAVASMALGLSMGAGVSVAQAQDAAASDADTVVVTGIRKSLQSALKQKRNSDRVSEIITAEDIGKFPDKNVADSLARATGVNVVTGSANAGGFGENERISIRGTDPTLNLTLMDGHNVATGDWFVLDQTNGGRSFNYTMLPSEVVGTVEVIKASSADLPEGGIGGTVDVHVRKPLDLKAGQLNFSAQALYATLAEEWTPNVSGMYSWKNDNKDFGFLIGGYYEKRQFRRDGQEVLGYASVANFAGSGQTLLVPSLIGSAYFTQERVRKGANFMMQWKSDKLDLAFSGLYTHLEADNENHNFMLWGSKLSGQTPNSYTTKDGFVTSATWDAADAAAAGGAIVQDDIFRKAHSSTYVLNLDIGYDFTDSFSMDAQLGFTSGEGVTDDTAAWETYWDNVGASYTLGKVTNVAFAGLPTDPTSAAYLNNKFSWSWGGTIKSPDKEAYAKLDFKYDLNSGIFKSIQFGARYTDHSRVLDYLAYAWGGNGANSGASVADLGSVFKGGVTPDNYADDIGNIPGYSYADADAVYDYLDSNNGGRTFAFYPPLSFSVEEKTSAYYAMTKLGGDNWRGNVGLRAVKTETTSTQWSANAPVKSVTNVFGSWGSETTDKEYWDYLPSANFVYTASDTFLIRAGAAKVMTRPGYAQLAGAFSLVDSNLTGTAGGNPNLEPYRAWQTNLGAEWYYAPEALVSFGVFNLDIDNYITTETFTQFFTTQQTPQGALFTMSGPANGGKATAKGFEFSVQQPLAYGFGFIFNYTYVDAKYENGDPLDGNSKNTFNLTGYFENDLITTRLAYNFRSKFNSGKDRGTVMWQDDYGTLDGSFSYNLNEHVALTLDAQNLLGENLYYFVGTPDIPRAIYDNGQSFYVGARFKY